MNDIINNWNNEQEKMEQFNFLLKEQNRTYSKLKN